MLGLSAQEGETYANYERYAQDNLTVLQPVAVLMGNSIFDNWAQMDPEFFTDHNYVGRGISGQVTAQMLARFRSDVLALKPQAVVILAGTNDIAQNNLYVPEEKIAENIYSMAELAKAHGIKPVICSILPVYSYHWSPAIQDVPAKISKVNALLQAYAAANDIPYVNLFDKMKDERQGLPKTLSGDGVHPKLDGYAIMAAEIVPVVKKLTK